MIVRRNEPRVRPETETMRVIIDFQGEDDPNAPVLAYPEEGQGEGGAYLAKPNPVLRALRIGGESKVRVRARWTDDGWMVVGTLGPQAREISEQVLLRAVPRFSKKG